MFDERTSGIWPLCNSAIFRYLTSPPTAYDPTGKNIYSDLHGWFSTFQGSFILSLMTYEMIDGAVSILRAQLACPPYSLRRDLDAKYLQIGVLAL